MLGLRLDNEELLGLALGYFEIRTLTKAMLKIKNSILIQVSTEKVFAFLAVPENLPLWNYYLITVNKISSGNPVVGSQYHQIRKKDEQYFEITGFEENKFIEFTSTRPSLIQFKRKIFFSSTNDGCMIDDLFELRAAYLSVLRCATHFEGHGRW